MFRALTFNTYSMVRYCDEPTVQNTLSEKIVFFHLTEDTGSFNQKG